MGKMKQTKLLNPNNKNITKQVMGFLVILIIGIGIVVPIISKSYAASSGSYNGMGNGTGWWRATFSNTSYSWNPKSDNSHSVMTVSANGSATGYAGTESKATTYITWMAYYTNVTTYNNGKSKKWDRILYSGGTEYLKSDKKTGKLYSGGPVYKYSISGGRITWTRTCSTQSFTFYIGVRSNTNGFSVLEISNNEANSGGKFTVPVADYNVIYNANSGSGQPATQLKPCGTNIALSSIKPTRAGYTFNGWNTNSAGTGTAYSPGSTYKGNADVTLYAQWIKDSTITFDANGGTGAPPAQAKPYNTTITLSSTVPTREGYVFKTWNTNAVGTGTNYKPGSSFSLNSDTTLYAYWIKLPEACEDWEGYRVEPADSSANLGYNSGYFCLHLAKDGIMYDSNKVLISVKNEQANKTTALYNANVCDGLDTCAQKWKFKNLEPTSGILVSDSPTTEYPGYKTSLNGLTSTGFTYTEPTLKVTVPRGYKYSTYYIPYNSELFSSSGLLTDFKTNSHEASSLPNPRLFEGNSDAIGPFNVDKEVSGYLGLGIETTGVITRSFNGNAYRTFQSANINFIPNKTTIKFNAGDGIGTMEDQEYTYDSALKLDNNTFSKDDFTFIGWTSNIPIALEDGTIVPAGELIPDGSVISKTAFPTETEVTFTANYRTNQTHIVKYATDSNGHIAKNQDEVYDGETVPGVDENPKKGYKTIGWRSDKDVKLIDGKEIEANKVFTKEELTKIVVKDDLKTTVLHQKEKYTIYYESANGITWSTEKETVEYGKSPTATYRIDPGKVLEGFVADTDVTLTDGTKIVFGNTISVQNLYKIKVEGNLKLKAVFKSKKSSSGSVKKNPTTGDIIKPYIAVALLTFLGVTFFTILREDRKVKEN